MTVPLDPLLSGGCAISEETEHVWSSTLQLPEDKTFVNIDYIIKILFQSTLNCQLDGSMAKTQRAVAACSLNFHNKQKNPCYVTRMNGPLCSVRAFQIKKPSGQAILSWHWPPERGTRIVSWSLWPAGEQPDLWLSAGTGRLCWDQWRSWKETPQA